MNTFEHLNAKQLVARVGETDQEFLSAPTPQLAITRAFLRLQLVNLSHQHAEKVYFLTEAAALLELALMEVEEPQDGLQLSAGLGEVYLAFYQVTHEQRYLTICKQILKPLSQLADARILLALARSSAADNHPALTKHWLSKLLQLQDADLQHIRTASEFAAFKDADWFNELLQHKLH